MKSKSIVAALCVACVTLFFASCDNDGKSSTGPSDTFDIVGKWGVTEVDWMMMVTVGRTTGFNDCIKSFDFTI